MLLKTLISLMAIWGSQIVIVLANIVTQAILARSFSPNDYGEFVSALSIISIFSTLAAFGISQYWLKIFGREGLVAFRWMKYSRYLILFSITSSTLLCLIFIVVTGNDQSIQYTIILLPLIIHTAFYSLLTAIFQLSRQYIKMSVFQTFLPLSKLMVAVLVISYLSKDLIVISAGYSIAGLFLTVISTRYYVKFIKRKIPLLEYENMAYSYPKETQGFLTFLKEIGPYGFLGFVYLIYYQIDVFMINTLDSSRNAAYYSIAISMLSAIYVFPTAIYQRYFGPQIHKWIYHDEKKVQAFYNIGNEAMIYLSAFIVLGIGLFGEILVLGIFGREYSFSYEILIFLSLSIPFRLLGNNMGTIFNTGNFVNSKLLIQSLAALINILLNYILLITMGVYGAIIATIFTEFFVWFLFRKIYLKRENLSLPILLGNKKIFIFLLFSYTIFLFSENLNTIIFTILWFIIFFTLLKSFIKKYYMINQF